MRQSKNISIAVPSAVTVKLIGTGGKQAGLPRSVSASNTSSLSKNKVIHMHQEYESVACLIELLQASLVNS